MSAQEFKPGDRVRTHNGVGTVRGPNAPATVEYDDGGWDSLSNPRIIASICRLDEPTEPEDKDDLYVEPEPLKAGDWGLVWARVTAVQETTACMEFIGNAAINPSNRTVALNAIVRPAAGQVPPWVKPSRCTSLREYDGGVLKRCINDASYVGHHFDGRVSWTDDEAYGRVEVRS